MGYGSHHVSSSGFCISTEDYNDWVDDHYPNTKKDDDDEKIIPKWFYLNLSYCDDCEKYIDFQLHVIFVKKILKHSIIEK